ARVPGRILGHLRGRVNLLGARGRLPGDIFRRTGCYSLGKSSAAGRRRASMLRTSKEVHGWLRAWVSRGFWGLLTVCLLGATVKAQDKNPFAGDANAATMGASQFRANCAFCHGLGARGGGRGPDLTRAQKKHGNSDADLFRTINQGVPGTAMPPNGATQQGVGMTDDEIWQVI